MECWEQEIVAVVVVVVVENVIVVGKVIVGE